MSAERALCEHSAVVSSTHLTLTMKPCITTTKVHDSDVCAGNTCTRPRSATQINILFSRQLHQLPTFSFSRFISYLFFFQSNLTAANCMASRCTSHFYRRKKEKLRRACRCCLMTSSCGIRWLFHIFFSFKKYFFFHAQRAIRGKSLFKYKRRQRKLI